MAAVGKQRQDRTRDSLASHPDLTDTRSEKLLPLTPKSRQSMKNSNGGFPLAFTHVCKHQTSHHNHKGISKHENAISVHY